MVLIGDFDVNDEYFRFDVSVPLRGLWFLSTACRMPITGSASTVSVPLRGLWFLSRDYARFNLITFDPFPSPYGDYGSYHECDTDELLNVVTVSVPLRGLWFLSPSRVRKTQT